MIKFSAINESFIATEKDKENLNEQEEKSADKENENLSKERAAYRARLLYEEALELQLKDDSVGVLRCLEDALLAVDVSEYDVESGHMHVIRAAVYKLLANTHRKLGNHRESAHFYRLAIKMNHQDLNLWYGLAVTYEYLCDWDEAVESYERVLTINNVHWPSLDALIVITFALVDFEKCAVYCQQALLIDGQYDAAIYFLQQIFSYQPFLKTLMKSFLHEIPSILTDVIDNTISIELEIKVLKIKNDISDKCIQLEKSAKIPTVSFRTLTQPLSWECVAKSIVKLYSSLKESNKLENIIDVQSILPDSAMTITTSSYPSPLIGENVWSYDDPYTEIITPEGCAGTDAVCDVICPEDKTGYFRITRNTAQMVESTNQTNNCKTEHYFARLIRMNILNEVHAMANEKFNEYNELVSRKKETIQSNSTSDTIKYRAKPLNKDNVEDILLFVHSFDGRKVSIIEVAWSFVKFLVTKEYFIWSSELIEDYLTLSNAVRTHVSSQEEESPLENLVSIKRFLLEIECLIDRKQSELEGKLRKKSRKELKFYDFLPIKSVDQFSDRIMKLQIHHGEEYERELTIIQIRVLWLGFILAEMCQNDDEIRLQLESLQQCLMSFGIPVHLRPNCIHHSVITFRKVEDCLLTSFKSLKIDLLTEMYERDEYDSIIDKTDSIIGTVVLPKEDYAEEMNNYMIKISFNCSSYHKILCSLLETPSNNIECDYLVKIYFDTTSVLEEVTNIVDILNDHKQNKRTPLTDRQMSFLKENYFKVSEILLTNATKFLKLLQLKKLNLIELIGVGEVSRFIVLAKEYFYHCFYSNIKEINVAHIWCIYNHFKSLELHDPFRYNQSVTYDPNDELDLPPSLNFLSLIHDYLGSLENCAQSDGAILKLIIHAVCEYIEDIRPKFRKLGVFLANHSDVLSLLDQALYCIRPVQRPAIDKCRKPIEHGTQETVTISLSLVDLLLSYLEPERVPEIDSVKNHSIAADLNNHFLEIIRILPQSIFDSALSEEAIIEAIESEEPLNFPSIPRSKYSRLFYFVADHFFKNNEFERALEYYIKNLRFTPICFDSWAGIALIYYKRLEDKFNMMDNDCETLSHEEVMYSLNSFNHAISLDSENLTILVEKGCFCYEVHSYGSRILKKALTRDIDESFVKDCEMWSKMMLENAKECYQMALDIDGFKEEKWLYYYMLSKCMEKSDENSVIDVLNTMEKAMEALDSSGAKYVRKVIFYTKIPYRAVEAVEVYYKYHASILKCLLKNQSYLLGGGGRVLSCTKSKKIDHTILLDIQQRLINMNQSSFIVNVGKMKNTKAGAKKRIPLKLDEYDQTPKVRRLSPTPEPAVDLLDMANIPLELRYEDQEDDCIIHEVILPSQPEDIKTVYERCIDLCRTSMEVVLQRLPLHYKAIYHLASIHNNVPHLKNIEKSYDYLMGYIKNEKSTINGLFKDRKSSNFFSGIWRIPVADIDRNGSFAHHMYRSMNLLMTVLRQMNAWKDLISINTILRKSGHDKKGFLSNADRKMLVRKSLGHALYSVKEWLTKYNGDVSKDDLILIQSLFCMSVKQCQGIDKMKSVLKEAFYRCGIAKELYVNEEKIVEAMKIDNLNMNIIEKVMINLREQKK